MRSKPTRPIFYVYEHWRPDVGTCFWVGKGQQQRAWNMRNRNQHHSNIVSKLTQNELVVDVRIVADGLLEADAHKLEVERIKMWRDSGTKLVNVTNGGEGIPGLKHTKESRTKMSSKLKGRKRGPRPLETRKKIAEAHRGKKRGPCPAHSAFMTGRKLTDEHKAKISAGNVGRVISPETRIKIGKGNKGKIRSVATIQRLSAAHLGNRLSAETKAKMSASHTKKWLSDEFRIKHSERITAALSRSDARKNLRNAQLRRYQDPREREKARAFAIAGWEKRRAST
jgi:hypothetical protein